MSTWHEVTMMNLLSTVVSSWTCLESILSTHLIEHLSISLGLSYLEVGPNQVLTILTRH